MEKGQTCNLIVYVNNKPLVFRIRRRRWPLSDGSEYMVVLENCGAGVCRDGKTIEETIDRLLGEIALWNTK